MIKAYPRQNGKIVKMKHWASSRVVSKPTHQGTYSLTTAIHYSLSYSSFVLNFAYAEAQEANKNYEEVHATFDKFLEVLRKDLQVMEERVNAVNASQVTDVGNLSQESSSSSNSQSSDESKPSKNKELSDRRTEYGLAWIVYMRFARRAENLKSARAVFGKARRDKWTPWEVYEAAGAPKLLTSKS